MLNFWGPKKYKKVINSSTKCLISVKIAIMTPHIIPLPLVNVWLIFDLQKYVNWLCVFWKVNPFFQKAQVFCMDLQPAADPYNVVCTYNVATSAVAEWFDCAWLQKIVNALAPAYSTMRCVKGKVALILALRYVALPHCTHCTVIVLSLHFRCRNKGKFILTWNAVDCDELRQEVIHISALQRNATQC